MMDEKMKEMFDENKEIRAKELDRRTDEKTEEIMKKIEESAQNVIVPEALEPEQIRKKLNQEQNQRRWSRRRGAKAATAAAVALLLMIGGTYAYQLSQNNTAGESMQSAEAVGTEISQAASDASVQEAYTKKDQVGSYRLAKSYEEVEDAIATVSGSTAGKFFRNDIKMNSAETDDLEEAKEESTSIADFSTTNTQVAGVDESDFVKNDGSYLYVQSQDTVSVIDIREDKMKIVTEIMPELGTSDVISDMFVDGERVYLVVEKYDTNLTQNIHSREDSTDEVYSVVNMDTTGSTELLTYDISGKEEAELLGSVTVDGNYNTSRKVGDMIYLFTSRYIEDEDDAIPRVNGGKIPAGCFYIQENSTKEFITVSVDVNRPDETVDQLVLMNAYVNVYMGLDSIYLYAERYDENGEHSYTDITKFSYKDGYMDAVAAASVIGTIQDTFAISEEDGILRVLTTDWTEQSENRLYLLDENLKRKGILKDFANGEEIYAARYIGDIVYFITYHNTDPLFAVDISDPTEPKLLGQIEMTGFSDYLHPYGENLLLGIGYETDPETSEVLGVKLTMFDTSDPVDLKIVDSVVLNADYCAAASNYKCALVNADKNLIGFDVTEYTTTTLQKYLVYSWKNNHFSQEMVEELDKTYNGEQIRGLYAGNRFYLISHGESGYRLKSYDMDEKFKELDELQVK